jgi:hypothetical protein
MATDSMKPLAAAFAAKRPSFSSIHKATVAPRTRRGRCPTSSSPTTRRRCCGP